MHTIISPALGTKKAFLITTQFCVTDCGSNR